MRSLWKVSKAKIGPFPCIELRTVYAGYENVEYTLSGPRGDIWEAGQGGRYKAIICRAKNGRLSSEEQLVRFGEEDLAYWVAELQVPHDPKDQTPWANSFSRRNK